MALSQPAAMALSKLNGLKEGDEEAVVVTVLSVSPLMESRGGVPYCSVTLAGYDGEARLVVFKQKAERLQSHVRRGDRIEVNVKVTSVEEHAVVFGLTYKGIVKQVEGAVDGGNGRFHLHTMEELLNLTAGGCHCVSDVVGVVLGVSGVDVKKRKKDQKEVILSKVTFGCVCMKKVVITLWEEQARGFAGKEGMLCAMKGVRFVQSDADGLTGNLGHDGSVYFQVDIGPGRLISWEPSVTKFSEVSAWFESVAPTEDAFVSLSKVWAPPPAREMRLAEYQWELKQCKGTMETDFIEVLLSVEKVMVKTSLYYMACNKMRLGERGQTKMCKKELVAGGRCKKCGPVPDPVPLLRVRAAFVDAVLPSVGVDVVASSSRVKPQPIWLTAFGSTAESIFGFTAEQCRDEGEAAILQRVRFVEQERKVHRCVLKGTSVDHGEGYKEEESMLCAVRPNVPSTRAAALVADLAAAPAIPPAAASAVTLVAGVASSSPADNPTEGVLNDARDEGAPAIPSAAASAVTFVAGVASSSPADNPTDGVINDARDEGIAAALAVPAAILAAEESSPSPVEARAEMAIDGATTCEDRIADVPIGEVRDEGTVAALAVPAVMLATEESSPSPVETRAEMAIGGATTCEDGIAAVSAAALDVAPAAAPVATLAADGVPVNGAGESSPLSVKTPKKIVTGEARSQEKRARGEDADTTVAGRRSVVAKTGPATRSQTRVDGKRAR